MRKYRLLNYLFCVIFLGQFMSFRKSDDKLTKVFNQTELKTIEKIIRYYDDFVISQTDNQLPIDKAYIACFEKMKTSIKEADDFDMFLPSIDERIVFYKTLEKKVLSEFYDIKDTLTFRYKGENEARNFYRPYSFTLNYDGKFVSFLKELSSKNEFFRNYYESVQAAGDISPSNYGMLLHDFNKIDFKNREERFVVIISLLRIGKTIYPDR